MSGKRSSLVWELAALLTSNRAAATRIARRIVKRSFLNKAEPPAKIVDYGLSRETTTLGVEIGSNEKSREGSYEETPKTVSN